MEDNKNLNSEEIEQMSATPVTQEADVYKETGVESIGSSVDSSVGLDETAVTADEPLEVTVEATAEITAETTAEPSVSAHSVADGTTAPGYAYFSSLDEERREKLRRKREIRRLSNATAIPLIGFDIVGFVVALILQIFLIVLLGQDRTEELLRDPDFNYLFSGFFSIIYLLFPFLLINKMTGIKLKSTVAFGRCRFSKAISAIMLGFGVIAVSQYASSYFSLVLENILGRPVVNPAPEYGTGVVSWIINLVCVGLIPAVMEEFAFRGVILGTTRKFTSDGLSILINATLFSMFHGNIHQIPFTFALGLYLSYITVYTGSVVPAMVVHGVNNSLAVVLSMLTDSASGLAQTVISVSYYVILLLVGILGLIIFINSDKDPLRLSKERSEDAKTVAGDYFSSAGFIIFAIMTFISVLDVQYGLTSKIIEKM
ncbi:MAG: CPBP family intramembrane metalloprotease [Ruminococcaceae bacterium]|nr:CPBP family intramembrane metalloprotease [Oscillospiraceae bacterium]